MSTPCEYTLVEKPIIELLTGEYGPKDGKAGYVYIPPSEHEALRGVRENEVFFTPILVESLMRINDIPESTAKSIASELASLADNERWLEIFRGKYSKNVEGEDGHKTIKVVDFDNPENNHFAVTNQLKISGKVNCIPDLIIYLNGIPVVVIEAKSPLAPKKNTWKAVDQIRQYEENIPRLFAPNLFNIATNNLTCLYGSTASPAEFWAQWKDPWPRKAAEFFDETKKGIYSLLAPERLLDLLAHFVIFETRDGKTIKKMCRYQQYRAVNKMVQRVVAQEEKQGLIWHTQGSGKSLTMVFAALKLKFHRGISSPNLENPNLLVITDRTDLHDQISKTFVACGLPDPKEAASIRELRELVAPNVSGRTVMSTVFKFQWDTKELKSVDMRERKAALKKMAVPGSGKWILMVDEAHRTQEKDLGAYMRAILPDAHRFGFTGTPVQKGDKDTFRNFGVAGENYLDKYGIQDAVNDGATVPVYYQGRLTDWHLEGREVDVLFDQYFANEPAERLEEIKKRGVTRGDLARFRPRIALIALDIWTHFREHVLPDGFKAQIVAVDRPACVVYKEELDRVITKYLMKTEGLDQDEAFKKASAMSLCVYSPGQHDQAEHPELVKHQLGPKEEKDAKENFNKPDHDLKFLIVCNKLLTGFDAPIEQAMYLDNPLSDHNLLQAIARTNRRYGTKKVRGSIVDYVGVSKNLVGALAAYNKEDIEGALTDEDALYADLQTAHREVMAMLDGVERTGNPDKDLQAAILFIEEEDTWFEFQGKANDFLVAYGALSPDPRVFEFKPDLKFIGSIIPQGKQRFELSPDEVDWRQYSEKVREILAQHLEVTGLSTALKVRSMADDSFWGDFTVEKPDLETAAVRKLVELKKETTERTAKNPARYGKFSEHVQKLIDRFQSKLLEARDVIGAVKKTAEDLQAEDNAFQKSGLSEQAYDVYKILENFSLDSGVDTKDGEEDATASTGKSTSSSSGDGEAPTLGKLSEAAAAIDQLYRTHPEAGAYWQEKPQARKKLLQEVRRIVHPLGLSDWQELKNSIDHFAVRHYAKP